MNMHGLYTSKFRYLHLCLYGLTEIARLFIAQFQMFHEKCNLLRVLASRRQHTAVVHNASQLEVDAPPVRWHEGYDVMASPMEHSIGHSIEHSATLGTALAAWHANARRRVFCSQERRLGSA